MILLLGIYFWREGFEGAFGPERRGAKGGWLSGGRDLLIKFGWIDSSRYSREPANKSH
jgi:hypothetical protein